MSTSKTFRACQDVQVTVLEKNCVAIYRDASCGEEPTQSSETVPSTLESNYSLCGGPAETEAEAKNYLEQLIQGQSAK